MRFRREEKHIIDAIFPIALFFVFAVTTLMVIILAANIYRNTTAAAEEHYTARTSLAYISEKIRQNDIADGVSIGSFHGEDALILSARYEDTAYRTYIYEYDGALRELFVRENTTVSPEDGQAILGITDFTMTEEDGCFTFSCTDSAGSTSRITVSVHSR